MKRQIRVLEEHDVGVHAHDGVPSQQRPTHHAPLLRPQEEHVPGFDVPELELRVVDEVRAVDAPVDLGVAPELVAQLRGGSQHEVVA